MKSHIIFHGSFGKITSTRPSHLSQSSAGMISGVVPSSSFLIASKRSFAACRSKSRTDLNFEATADDTLRAIDAAGDANVVGTNDGTTGTLCAVGTRPYVGERQLELRGGGGGACPSVIIPPALYPCSQKLVSRYMQVQVVQLSDCVAQSTVYICLLPARPPACLRVAPTQLKHGTTVPSAKSTRKSFGAEMASLPAFWFANLHGCPR